MIQTVRSYRLTRWVDTEIKKEDKKHPEVPLQGKKHRLSGQGVMVRYALLRHKADSEIRDLIEYCVAKNYLAREVDDGAHLFIDNEAGRDFLEGWKYFPWWGLVRELWSRDSKVILAIIGIVGGFFLGRL